ncbi:tetratricopeptide repeat-containing sulfotransferase family protein [Paraglaciecola sp. L3A3]|uniref:tetratricopeptide repeat-containing sulfotransferase family protein n=1 Tax=Paraglaciecola sp. L3A3 TaxID=2686358 RepID=UPI00131C1626
MKDIKYALQSGNTDKAISLCQQALESLINDEQQIEILYMLAVAQRVKGAISEASKTVDKLIPLAPENARAHQERAYLYLQVEDKINATKAFVKASKLNPALLSSWQQLIHLFTEVGQTAGQNNAIKQVQYLSSLPNEIRGARDLMYEGKLALADTVCRRFLQSHKHHAEAMLLLAEIGIQLKLYHEAEFLLESCVEIHPTFTTARAEFVNLLSKLGKFSQAKQQAEILLGKHADSHPFLAAKASAMVGIGEIEDAIKIYQYILNARNDLPGIQLLLGHAYKANGDIKQAIAAYQQAYKIRPSFGDAYWSLANTKTYQFSEQELELMQDQLSKIELDHDDKVHIQFALAKTYEDNKQFEKAFSFYQYGNSAKNQRIHYSQGKLSEQISAQKSVFNLNFFSTHENLGNPDPAPIFIVGLPRAGSTLLEQILASHSMVDGTMELHNILGLAARLSSNKSGYPKVVNDIDHDYFARFGKQFIEETQTYRQGAPFFIDKMPNNFMHIGLIKAILPNAKIIDARREPIACCFSGYKQLFAEGQEFSYNLDNLAHYYQSYQSLMDHWDSVLPGFVLRVQHEDVIEDLETQVRRLLDFCQLPFETSCLQFYKTKRAIKTPSSEQVRQPINANAREQWKNFESFLTPLTKVFDPS